MNIEQLIETNAPLSHVQITLHSVEYEETEHVHVAVESTPHIDWQAKPSDDETACQQAARIMLEALMHFITGSDEPQCKAPDVAKLISRAECFRMCANNVLQEPLPDNYLKLPPREVTAFFELYKADMFKDVAGAYLAEYTIRNASAMFQYISKLLKAGTK